jgi:hypothetical protein
LSPEAVAWRTKALPAPVVMVALMVGLALVTLGLVALGLALGLVA